MQTHFAFFRPGFKKVEHLVDFIRQVERLFLRDELVIVGLSQKQHVAYHLRHTAKLFEVGVEYVFQLFLAAGLA